jgi:hypothetical protein
MVLGTQVGPLYQPRIIDEGKSIGRIIMRKRKTGVLGEKPVPLPLCLRRNSIWMSWN